jgi:hypothetical protein
MLCFGKSTSVSVGFFGEVPRGERAFCNAKSDWFTTRSQV